MSSPIQVSANKPINPEDILSHPALQSPALQALTARKQATKKQLKQEQKARKSLSPDDTDQRNNLSRDIKATKKALHAIELQIQAEVTKLLGETDTQHSDAREAHAVDDHYPDVFSIEVENLDGWDEFCAQHNSSAYHYRAWRDIFGATMGRGLHYMSARAADGKLLGILPLALTRSRLFGHYAVSLPYVNYGGPLAVASNVASGLIQAAFDARESLELGHVEVRDTVERSDFSPRLDKVSLRLDLRPYDTFEQFLGSVGSKVRAQVRKALRSGITFQDSSGRTLLQDFYAVFAENMRDLGTPVYPQDFFGAILEQFPQQAHLIVGYFQGRPVCGAFLLKHNGQWEIPWASTLRRANKIAANMALYGRVLQVIIDRGGNEFDFGRSSVDAGTYKFKRQWGAQPTQLYWYHSDPAQAMGLTTESPKYRLAIGAWKRLPVFATRLIGPHIIKDLP